MKKSLVVVILILALISVTTFIYAQSSQSQDGYMLVVEVDDSSCSWDYDIYSAAGAVADLSGTAPGDLEWSVTCQGLITLPEDVDIQTTQKIVSSSGNDLGNCLVKPYDLVTNEWQLVLTAEEKSQVTCTGSKNPYPYPPKSSPTSDAYPYPPPATPTADAYPYPSPATPTPKPTVPPPPKPSPSPTPDEYPYP